MEQAIIGIMLTCVVILVLAYALTLVVKALLPGEIQRPLEIIIWVLAVVAVIYRLLPLLR